MTTGHPTPGSLLATSVAFDPRYLPLPSLGVKTGHSAYSDRVHVIHRSVSSRHVVMAMLCGLKKEMR